MRTQPSLSENFQTGEGPPPGLDTSSVSHDGHPVQGGLPIKEHNVPILQVPLHNIPNLEVSGHAPPVPKLQKPTPPFSKIQEIGSWPGSHTCDEANVGQTTSLCHCF